MEGIAVKASPANNRKERMPGFMSGRWTYPSLSTAAFVLFCCRRKEDDAKNLAGKIKYADE